MRIVLDLQGAQSISRFRGIGRYSLSLALAIVRNRGEHQVFIVLNGIYEDTIEPIRKLFAPFLPNEQIRIWYAPGPIAEDRQKTDLRREAAEYIREAFIAQLNPDIIHLSSLFEGFCDNAATSINKWHSDVPVSATFYDLIPYVNPKEYLDSHPIYKKHYLRKFNYLKKASLLLAISEFSRQEALENLPLPPDLVVNISAAADDIFSSTKPSVDPEDLLKKLEIKHPFILFAGGEDPRKNLLRFLKAYNQLPSEIRQNRQLVLAGKISPVNLAQHLKISKEYSFVKNEVIFTGYLTDSELHTLYCTCEVFIFPSWHEGFGLPALEAMKSGAAVIASNMTSIPEIIENPAALFNPLSTEAITEKLLFTLSNEEFKQSLRANAQVQAKKFSWDISAKRAIAAFEYCHSKHLSNQKLMTSDAALNYLLKQLTETTFIEYPPNKEDLLRLSACIAQTFPATNRKRQFLIDISELVVLDAKTGIQRVVRSIITELLNQPPKNYEVRLIYADKINLGYRYATAFTKQFLAQSKVPVINDQLLPDLQDEAIETQTGDIFLGLDLQSQNIQVQQQFLNGLHLNGVNIFFVVYDLLPVYFPHAFPQTVDLIHARWLKQISQYDGIFCISQAVANDYKSWAQDQIPNLSPQFHIEWFHLGADIQNSVPTLGLPANASELLNKLTAVPSFVLIGTIEPRKGYPQVLKAFESLWAKGANLNLIIIGKQGWLMDEFVNSINYHPQLNHHLFWLNSISDEYLEAIYAASTCLICASAGEGFGLPLIEAASRKLPIIARDIPVFREVAGNSAFYFTGDEPNDVASAVEAWLQLFNNQSHPKSDTMQWFTWKESTQMLVNKLLHLVENHSNRPTFT